MWEHIKHLISYKPSCECNEQIDQQMNVVGEVVLMLLDNT